MCWREARRTRQEAAPASGGANNPRNLRWGAEDRDDAAKAGIHVTSERRVHHCANTVVARRLDLWCGSSRWRVRRPTTRHRERISATRLVYFTRDPRSQRRHWREVKRSSPRPCPTRRTIPRHTRAPSFEPVAAVARVVVDVPPPSWMTQPSVEEEVKSRASILNGLTFLYRELPTA